MAVGSSHDADPHTADDPADVFDSPSGLDPRIQRLAVEPPMPESLARVALRYWWLVLLPVLALVGAAIGLGLQREPTYRAQSELNVGSINARTQAVPGYVEAAKSLASSYSRMTETRAFLVEVSRRADLSVAEVRDRLAVSPVVDNALITVQATGRSEQDAVGLTRQATRELVRTVGAINRRADDSADLLRDYRRKSLTASRAEVRAQRLRNQVAQDASRVSSGRLARAESEAATAKLEADTAGQRYTAATQVQSPAAGVEVIDPARATGDDQREQLQKMGFVGLVAGLVVGLGFAALADRRRRRRLLR